jgi:hypothetical protein
MPRLLRILLSLSLVVSLASALLWALGYFWMGSFSMVGGASVGHGAIGGGRITFVLQHGPGTAQLIASEPGAAGFYEFRCDRDRAHYFDFNEGWRDSLRFGWRAEVMTLKSGATIKSRQLAVPLWCPTCLCAIAPAIVGRRRRARQRRIREGRCLKCGYDLRASVERCPECGAALEPRPVNPPPPLRRTGFPLAVCRLFRA